MKQKIWRDLGEEKNSARIKVVEHLIQLFDEGKGEVYCEPHTRTAIIIDLSMTAAIGAS